ncbi:MAG: hypothetical protein FWG15_08870 [Propionibacteriaceae bacterium]|nr:hypothetical protein [Propionibacteriaceae bacterium]
MVDELNRQATVGDMRFGAARSRRLLVDTVRALGPFSEATTVIGAHAVHVWVEKAWGTTDMEATRDGDIVLNPVFVTDDPKLLDLMASVGITPALEDRPGIYGFAEEAHLDWRQRTTVDLIVPEVYAGPGRRVARIAGQRNAASRAAGLELAVWDRELTTLSTIDEPVESVQVHVAGPAALLVAKAHKVHERMADAISRPHRIKPKDSGDVALLMMVSDPVMVAQVLLEAVRDHSEIRQVVSSAAIWLTEMYGGTDTLPRRHAIESLVSRFDEAEVAESLDSWLSSFRDSTLSLAEPRNP